MCQTLSELRPAATAGRQAARDLALASGTSLLEAERALQAAQQLEAQPEVAAAALAGELSRPQLGLVAGAVAVNPGAAPRLLALAQGGSLGELGAGAARARAAHQDLEARRHAVHRARGLRPYTDASGTSHLHAKGSPEEVAMVMAAIAPFAERALVAAGEQGRRERPEAYAFDGLVAMAGAGGAQAPRAEVLFRVDHEVMLRGYPLDGEVCEVPGFGPVSTQAVADAMDCGDPILKAVVTRGKDVVSVAHLGRRPTAAQQTALDWLFPSCAAEGCGTAPPTSSPTTGSIGPRPTSLCWTCSSGCASSTITRRPIRAGLWCTDEASGRSSRPTTPATLANALKRPK